MTTYRYHGLGVRDRDPVSSRVLQAEDRRVELRIIVGKTDRVVSVDLSRDQLLALAAATIDAIRRTEPR